MCKRKLLLFMTCIMVVSLFATFIGCSDSGTGGSRQSQDDNNSVAEALADNSGNDEDADDYILDSSIVDIDLTTKIITGSGGAASFSDNIVTIASAGTYSVSGILSIGQIIVSAGDEDIVKLILDEAIITNSTGAPLYIENAGKTIINLEGASNSVTDNTTYSDGDEPIAAIFSKDYLSIYGMGSLTVHAAGTYADGIASKDGLVIKSGTINITAGDDGIRGKDYLIVRDGNITVTSGGDGLKSTNDDDSTKGYVYIEDGTIKITSTGDGIAAETDVLVSIGTITIESGGGSSHTVSDDESAKGIKGLVSVIIDNGTFPIIDSADDAIHSNDSMVINDGTFEISTGDDGLHSDLDLKITGGEIDITDSVEGIESALIIVDGVNLSLVASDDGFNATQGSRTEQNDGSFLYLNGGDIYVDVSDGDGLDSNGSIAVSGGTIVVHGTDRDPNVGMDYNGTCNISGGFMVISGINSNMTQGPSTSSSQYSLKLLMDKNDANTLFHIQDTSENDIVTFKPKRDYYSIIFSSPSLQKGVTYYIYTGGTTSGTDADGNGLFEGGEYDPGTFYDDFTISSIVTTIGSTGGGGGGPGGP